MGNYFHYHAAKKASSTNTLKTHLIKQEKECYLHSLSKHIAQRLKAYKELR
uniref:Uncharacterized protein n=1 Tax=Rhizophora mucronata TaxID=61149 RepID=A0A2P2PTC9_RHIMU